VEARRQKQSDTERNWTIVDAASRPAAARCTELIKLCPVVLRSVVPWSSSAVHGRAGDLEPFSEVVAPSRRSQRTRSSGYPYDFNKNIDGGW
jgi:hypothetical protein